MIEVAPHQAGVRAWPWWCRDYPAGAVRFCCPRGHVHDLGAVAIAADGQLAEPIECRTKGCDFRAYVRLVGWGDVGHG